MVEFTEYGTILLQTKDGGVFETAAITYLSTIDSYRIRGTKKRIFKTTKEVYDNIKSIVSTPISSTYDVNDYTVDKIDEKAEFILSELKKIFPDNTYVILDNNVFITMIWAYDASSDKTQRYSFVVYLNNMKYETTFISGNKVKGVTPIRFCVGGGGNDYSSSATGEFWCLGGYYDFQNHNLKWDVTNSPEIICEDSSVGSSFYNFRSHSISMSEYVAEYVDDYYGYVEPRDTSLGLSVDYFRKLVYSAKNKNSAFPFMIAYLGSPDSDVSTDNRGGNSGTGGGNGDYDNSSDDIPIPGFPNTKATDTSLITLFKPTNEQLNAFSNKMWSNWWDGIAKSSIFYGDPADIVINISFVPVPVENGETIPDLKVAGASTGLSMTKAGNQYVEVDCGSIDIKEYWGSFMDYEPFTKIELVLPYCGSIRLDTDEVMNSKLSIVYHVDLLTGNCIAFIHTERDNLNSVIAQVNGNISYNIPITGDNFSKLTSTLLGIATGGVSTVAQNGAALKSASNNSSSRPTGSNAEASANAFNTSRSIATSANAVADVVASKPSVTRSGNFSANNGIFAIQYPYLIITRPIQSIPKSYSSHYGHLSNITESLSTLSGYTVVECIHLDGIIATEEEKDELEGLLHSGVIL